ncbi:MAG: hypothetical protein WD845_15905 [Pirellulales bacterium]
MRRFVLAACGILATCGMAAPAHAQSDSVAQWLATMQQVQREGAGNRAAQRAWSELASSADAYQLPTILAALDDADPLAANWIRAAVDTIAERHVQSGDPLPTEGLEKFLHEKQHNPRARRLAYEWIARVDPAAPDRLIPRMLDDPSLELRREAVERVIADATAAADKQQTGEAISTYREALVAARDLDQVKLIAEALAKLEQPVDLAHHFGFVMDWQLIGPFDSSKGVGFDAVYPPEKEIDLAAEYDGSAGRVKWVAHQTEDEYGSVDLNKAIGKHMGAAGYAMAEFLSDKQQHADVRVGSGNAVKVWLNGKLLASADTYHTNDVIDQYVGHGELKKGMNVILVKICQNEQTEDWAQDWKYQLRVCDPLGKAIHSTDRPGPNPKRPATAQASTE